MSEEPSQGTEEFPDDRPGAGLEVLAEALENWKLLLLVPLVCGVVAALVAFVIPATYTARSVLLPPQQNPQSSALAALSSLASTASGASFRSSTELYGSLLQTTSVADRLVDQFKLSEVYDVEWRADARKWLARNTRIDIGKKDNLISIEVDDTEPVRAAAIANAYVAELKRLAGQLALTEAQQRRVFFEGQLGRIRDDLAKAQKGLQSSGFSSGALRAEPKIAAESYARARVEVKASELRVAALRDSLADSSPEVRRELTTLAGLRGQLSRLETQDAAQGDSQYVDRYREFKYQESLLELFARQYELARTDEAREGALIQVVEVALPPEKRSKPQRRVIVLGALIGGALLSVLLLFMRRRWRAAVADPVQAGAVTRIRAVLRRSR